MAGSHESRARQHIAILHFTAPPHIGGVEALIAAQTRSLLRRGLQVTLLTASGTLPEADMRCLPLLHPDHPRIVASKHALSQTLPDPHHPLVSEVEETLVSTLVGMDQCWVHNAFTTFLNPFLTVALPRAVRRRPDIRWINWCADLSVSSRYWPEMSLFERRQVATPAGVEHVAISETRRTDLARALGIPEDSIRVIRPPLDVECWLDLGAEARSVLTLERLAGRSPLIFVPEKLLPHKNLELAVELTAELRSRGLQPLTLISGADSPHDPETSAQVHAALSRRAAALGISGHVNILARSLGRPPSRRAMRELMLLADFVFLPSNEEGFGMPLLEAAALRTPVLCADIPAFRESGGSAARYFSLSDSPASIADAAEELCAVSTSLARRAAVRSRARFEEDLDAVLTPGAKTGRDSPTAPGTQ